MRIRNLYPNISSLISNKTATGKLEIYHMGIWGGICYDNSPSIAALACRQLGYATGIIGSFSYPYLIKSKVWMKDISCMPSDFAINQCSFIYGNNSHLCLRPMIVTCTRKYMHISNIYIYILVFQNQYYNPIPTYSINLINNFRHIFNTV